MALLRYHEPVYRDQHEGVHAERLALQRILQQPDQEHDTRGQQVGSVQAPVKHGHQNEIGGYGGIAGQRERQLSEHDQKQ